MIQLLGRYNAIFNYLIGEKPPNHRIVVLGIQCTAPLVVLFTK